MGKNLRVYKKGDLIFAKMKGHPFWPARIETTSKEILSKKKYNIFFYGTHDTSMLKSETIVPYNEETKTKYGIKRRTNSFNDGLWEIEHDPKLKKIKNKPTSDSDQENIVVKSDKIVENLLKKIVKNISKNNVTEQNGDDLIDTSSSIISHEQGQQSYEIFCKYIGQFESTTPEQIELVQSLYKNLNHQQITSKLVQSNVDNTELKANGIPEPIEAKEIDENKTNTTPEVETVQKATESVEEKTATSLNNTEANIFEDIENAPNMVIDDDMTDQVIVDMVKDGVEVEEAIKLTH